MLDPKSSPVESEAARGRRKPKAPQWSDWGGPALVVAASTAAVLTARSFLAGPAPAPAPVPPDGAAPDDPISLSAPSRAGLARPAQAESHLLPVNHAARASAAQAVAAGRPAAFGRAPAWTARLPAQEWSWPTTLHSRLDRLGSIFGQDAAAKAAESRRLAGWFPGNEPGRQVQYALIDGDGAETSRVYTDGQVLFNADGGRNAGRPDPSKLDLTEGVGSGRLADARRQELANLAATSGATAAQGYLTAEGMPVAKLTFADGHQEVAYYDPLVFDLIGRGVKTSSRKVLFDLYGYGREDKMQGMNDIEEGTGVLVFDATHSGRAGKDGREVLGDRTSLYGGIPDGFADGFSALKGLVDKGVREHVLKADVVDSGVLDEAALKALEKAYGLKMRVGGLHGRTMTLAEAGIRGIALSNRPTKRLEDFDGRGNALMVQPGAVFLRADGSVGNYMNIWLTAKLGELGLK
jgi:hypothetical protein